MKKMQIGIKAPLERYKGEWRTILDCDYRGVLFHYTNLSGAVEIATSRTLWLSKASYLNDYSEVKWFIQKMLHIIELLPQFDIPKTSLEVVETKVRSLEHDYFVCSFSEDGDLLSQWRAYGSDGAGISIGFRAELLSSVATDNNARLVKCVYSSAEQDRLAVSLILELLNCYRDENPDEAKISDVLQAMKVASVACKSPSFSEENEWRLILLQRNDSNSKIKVRASERFLIPFFEFAFPSHSSRGIVEECVIGPSVNFRDIEEGLRILIAEHVCSEFAIRESHIPYR